ncbi:NAD(P)-binding protein, partial [Acephala macrosclerotiorum]
TYLITGASRGLGLGLVKTYISRPNNTVIAAVRGLSTATDLNSLPKGEGSTLILIAIDSSSPTSAQNAIDTLKTTHSIFQLDVVIANAGISNSYSPLAKVPLSDVQEHMNVNGIGPLLLFQAVFPLLKKGSKFVGVSSAISSIGGMEMRPFPCGAYGMSKAVLNYVVRKVHFENEELVSFALDPGFVQTEMGNTGAKIFGMNQATTPIDECVVGMAKVIDEATREKTSGKFPIWEGGEFPW